VLKRLLVWAKKKFKKLSAKSIVKSMFLLKGSWRLHGYYTKVKNNDLMRGRDARILASYLFYKTLPIEKAVLDLTLRNQS